MAAMTTLSPRHSFSRDVDEDVHAQPGRASTSDVEFDFSVSCDISLDESPADHLFSHGRLLPLSSLPPPSQQPHKINKPSSSLSLSSQVLNIGRSSSVGTTSSTVSSRLDLGSVGSFPRSKSTGSYLYPNPNPNLNQKSKSNQNQSQWKNWMMRKKDARSCYYYSGSRQSGAYLYGNSGSYNNGTRISPVINVLPPTLLPRGGSGGSSSTSSGGGLFAYLLCNCRAKRSAKELEVSDDDSP